MCGVRDAHWSVFLLYYGFAESGGEFAGRPRLTPVGLSGVPAYASDRPPQPGAPVLASLAPPIPDANEVELKLMRFVIFKICINNVIYKKIS